VGKAGQDLGVTSGFLLPVIGFATVITAFVTPYLIKFSFKSKDETVEGFRYF
jgi:CPA2 family monovalent cation:H+ antiporter-2